MAKRKATKLTCSVCFTIPASMSKKDAFEEFKSLVRKNTSTMNMHDAVIQLEKEEIYYFQY